MGKPKIRFKGYEDDWEQRKLSEFVDKAVDNRGKTPPIDDNGTHPLIEVAALGGVHPDYSKVEKYLNDDSFKNNLRAYVKEGDILFTTVGSIGLVSLMDSMEEAAIAQNIVAFRAKENFVPEYLYSLFSNEENQYKAKRIVMGAVQPSIKVSQLVDVEYMLTQNVKEQQKIGEYFSNLDRLITLHQRKCEETKSLKKYMLQKMFPENGKYVPEIRFSGFSDDWEQRKLGDNIIEYHEVTTENNQYPVLTSSRKGIFLQTEYYSGNQVASSDNTGYNVVPYGYFTYRHMSDDQIFYFNINDIVENGIVSTLYPVFTTNIKLDSRYLQYQLNYGREFAKFAILQKQGGSRTYMYLNKLKSLCLTMPKTIGEQKKISEYFMKLDHLITLHQHKCDELQKLKKFMLQNMFM